MRSTTALSAPHAGAGDEHPREVTNGRRRLRRRADHEPRRVDEEQDRQVERVALGDEPRRLVVAVGVDRATEMNRVVGDHADRVAVDPRQCRHHAVAEAAAQLEHRARIKQTIDDRAHVVGPLAGLGDQVAKCALIGHLEVVDRALGDR